MNISVIHPLLEFGSNVEAKTLHSFTTLHIAAFMGSKSAVRQLLDSGVSTETKTQYNLTALYIAAFRGCKSIVQQLLERGADVKAETQLFGFEDGEAHENGAVETADKSLSDLLYKWSFERGAADSEARQDGAVDIAEISFSDVLYRWLNERGAIADTEAEARHGLVARQLAARCGHVAVQRLLG